MDLTVLIPVLRRPHRVEPVLDSLHRNTTCAWRPLFICDPTDFPEQHAIKAQGADFMLIDGNYAAKINAGVRVTDTPFVFTGADDLDFHPDWFDNAAELMTEQVGVVGTQDLCNPRVIAGNHATHFLIARWYAELPTIDGQRGPLFEGYEHEFVDDELVGTARHRNAFAFAADSVVEHLHPDAGKAPADDIYAQQGARMRRSRPLYRQRRASWT